MFKRIDHVEIVTDRPEETARFYTEVLGFRVKATDRIERPGSALNLTYLDLGGTVVELIDYEGVPLDPAPQKEHLGYRMIALEIDDMDKAADYLKQKGVHRLGPGQAPDLRPGRDLRPQRLPHRTAPVVLERGPRAVAANRFGVPC